MMRYRSMFCGLIMHRLGVNENGRSPRGERPFYSVLNWISRSRLHGLLEIPRLVSINNV